MLTTDTFLQNASELRPRRSSFYRWQFPCVVSSAAGFLAAIMPTASDAAIAPWYERVRQFEFVMTVANDAAGKLAPHGSIDSIDRMDDGTFRFRAGECFVPARLEQIAEDEQPPRLGVQSRYKVTLGDVSCD